MGAPANQSALTVIIGEGEDGEWVAWVAPEIDNTTYVAFGERAGKAAVYEAARRAGWSQTDLATLSYTWPELSRRARLAMREQNPAGFTIGVAS
jgi:hypothetical protein